MTPTEFLRRLPKSPRYDQRARFEIPSGMPDFQMAAMSEHMRKENWAYVAHGDNWVEYRYTRVLPGSLRKCVDWFDNHWPTLVAVVVWIALSAIITSVAERHAQRREAAEQRLLHIEAAIQRLESKVP